MYRVTQGVSDYNMVLISGQIVIVIYLSLPGATEQEITCYSLAVYNY